jgi:formamidase
LVNMEREVGRLLSIVAAQVRPVTFDPLATQDKFESEVVTIVREFPRTDLLVFPELYVTGEDPFTGREPIRYLESVAQPIPGPLTDRLTKIAARAGRWIVAGSMWERGERSRLYNTALVLSPDGVIVARHRKMLPWAPWERVACGSSPTIFDIPGVGRVGVMTCYEGWFPEVARALALRGAELIVQPSLTTTVDREEELVLARANAIVNQCFLVNVNAASTIGGGRSIGADPEGRVLFQAGAGEELITEVLDLERVDDVRERGTRGLNRLWAHLREAPGIVNAYRSAIDDVIGLPDPTGE